MLKVGEVARPMYELTRKNARFVWDDRCRQAFETLKLRLFSAPVLATPTSEGVYVLDVDASTHGAGAILHQYQDGSSGLLGMPAGCSMVPSGLTVLHALSLPQSFSG